MPAGRFSPIAAIARAHAPGWYLPMAIMNLLVAYYGLPWAEAALAGALAMRD